MPEDKIPMKPMSIEQAGNYLDEKMETLVADMKKEVSKAPISVAQGEDRLKFIMYGLSMFDDVTEFVKNQWCKIANKSPVMFTTKEVALNMRRLLTLRAYGYSVEAIAKYLKCPPNVIIHTEQLAIKAAKEAIERRKLAGVPLVGGLN